MGSVTNVYDIEYILSLINVTYNITRTEHNAIALHLELNRNFLSISMSRKYCHNEIIIIIIIILC